MPSATLEEYLEVIYKAAERGEVRPGYLADVLGVSAPTVTATLGRLKSRGLIERSSGGGIALTEEGRQLALDIIRRHRLAERFLVDALGLSWDEVHDEACRLEHALSPRVQQAIAEFLDNPKTCPHGQPIPSADGVITEPPGTPLCRVASGSEANIIRIEDENEELLSYLSSLGMLPGTVVRVCDVAPFEGPLLIEVGESRYALGRDIAQKIIVSDSGPPRHRPGPGAAHDPAPDDER